MPAAARETSDAQLARRLCCATDCVSHAGARCRELTPKNTAKCNSITVVDHITPAPRAGGAAQTRQDATALIRYEACIQNDKI